jgi:hypothetical protein
VAKKFHGPFSDAHFLDVSILARTRFVDVLKLANQRERRFGAFRTLRKSERLSVAREGVIIIAVIRVGRTLLWITPNSVL